MCVRAFLRFIERGCVGETIVRETGRRAVNPIFCTIVSEIGYRREHSDRSRPLQNDPILIQLGVVLHRVALRNLISVGDRCRGMRCTIMALFPATEKNKHNVLC